MAAKSTAWTFAGFYVVILLYLLVCGQGGVMVDAADAGTDYLDRKESYVKDIAKRATQNQEACENLMGCKNACTRAVCHPSSGTKTTQCTPVDNNEFCGTGGNATSCKYMLLDYTRSFVTNEVKIIIDVRNTMATPVSADYGRPPKYSYLNLGQDIALELLQTFSPQDFVEVISFDSLNATSLGAPVNIMPYDSFNYSGRPELGPLAAKVGSLVTSSEVASSNLDAAIAKAVSSFEPSSTLTSTYLKVIIVLTNGLFAPLNSTTEFPSKALRDLRAKLMIYKLDPPNQQDPFLLLMTSLRDNLCSVNGSFELLEPQATLNPLYATRSYFTHLARVYLAVADKPTWSNKHLSYSQLHDISTVAYPVIKNDSLLIGVAGIDVAIEDLPTNLKNLVLGDFPNRPKGILSAPGTFPMTCDSQTAASVTICPTSKSSPTVCKRSDFTSTLQQRTCCSSGEGSGTCAVPDEPVSPTSAKPKIGVIVGSVVGGAALLVAIIATVLKLRHRAKTTQDTDPVNRPLPEDLTQTSSESLDLPTDDLRFRGNEQALGPGTKKS